MCLLHALFPGIPHMHLRRWREKIINELVFLLCHYSLSLSSEGFLMNPNGTAQAVVVASPLLETFDKSIATLLLSTVFLGFVLSLLPQHGHHTPSHLINTSHIAHLLCPAEYLLLGPSAGLSALCRLHIPLHVINHTPRVF